MRMHTFWTLITMLSQLLYIRISKILKTMLRNYKIYLHYLHCVVKRVNYKENRSLSYDKLKYIHIHTSHANEIRRKPEFD